MNPSPGLNLEAWRLELNDDSDKDFLLHGVANGFNIVDRDARVVPMEIDNHPSASPGSELFNLVKQQVMSEISVGNYHVCVNKPEFISPLGAIPKATGGIRLIHDCSRPAGNSLNDYATLGSSQKFQTIDDATSLIQRGYYMAKVDLKSAYRSVNISEESQHFTGLKFEFDGRVVYLRDTKLPFGSRLAPGIFHRLTQSVKRMMARRGFTAVIAYLDDFLIIAPTLDECATALYTLIGLLRYLGFCINWDKVVDPITRITFLGIEIDADTMSKRLPKEKLIALRSELRVFAARKRASRRQLQSLAGKLNWAAGVVYGGRVFLRRIFDAIAPLIAANHKCVLTQAVRDDIQWWDRFMSSFNGTSLILDSVSITTVYTDACDAAAGGYCEGDWFYCNWSTDYPQMEDSHINVKEFCAVVLSAQRWCHQWANKRVLVRSDNMTTVSGVNRGTTRSPLIMTLIRYMFWLSAVYNFRIVALHVPGSDNVIADKISRLHEPYSQHYLYDLLVGSPLAWHMSYNGYAYILDRSRPTGSLPG